ncbi:ATP-dependent DNA helicase II subunit 2 [Actinomortierella ambigua]|nr:ATP-dependent DNA helicase II subunit 2 [Actinomortierella ambigua]
MPVPSSMLLPHLAGLAPYLTPSVMTNLGVGGYHLMVGLVTGVMKYGQIVASKNAVAHPYISTAHRASLMYGFASVQMALMAALSSYSEATNMRATVAAQAYFVQSVMLYVIHGLLRDTTNQLKSPHKLGEKHALPGWMVHGFMATLVLGEIGGCGVLFAGMLKTFAKEATCYILDIGPTLKAKREGSKRPRLEETKEALIRLVANKVHMNRKTVYVSVVLVGSDVTNNDLASINEEGGEYQNIDVLQPFGVATVDLMKGIQNDVKLGSTMGDCLDGLIVAMDMMVKFCRKLKYEKKIIILTDASAPISPEGIDVVKDNLRSENIQLNVIGTDFDMEGTPNPYKTQTQADNENFFRELCQDTEGDIFALDEAVDMLTQFQTRKVKPTAVFRGTLDLGDRETHPDASLSIPIHMFARTMVARLPTAKKYSTVAEHLSAEELPEHGFTGLVNMQRQFKLKPLPGDDDTLGEETEVAEEDVERAYMYGKTIVPIRAVDQDSFKLRTSRGMSILGFFPAHTFRREWLISNVYSIFPAPDDPRAMVELLGLIYALEEKGSYALCRYVRVEDAEPKLGVLWPEITLSHKVLYFAPLAYNEDVRRFGFASLENIRTVTGKKLEKHRLLATDEDKEAMRKFVEAMDLMGGQREEDVAMDGNEEEDESSGSKEMLTVEETHNPAIQRQKQLVEFKAMNPTATELEFPPIHPQLLAQLMPKAEMLAKVQPIADQLIRMLDLKKVEDKGKGKRGYAASLEREGLASLAGATGSLAGTLDGSQSQGQESNAKRLKSESIFGTASSISGHSGLGAEGGDEQDVGNQSFSMNALNSSNVAREVGTMDPVGDFESMVKLAIQDRRQALSSDGVTIRPTAGSGRPDFRTAVEQMKAMVIKLIQDSFGPQYYPKATQCLRSLRTVLSSKEYVVPLPASSAAGRGGDPDISVAAMDAEDAERDSLRGHASVWNQYARELKQLVQNPTTSPSRTDFWELWSKQHHHDLGLITKAEIEKQGEDAGVAGLSEQDAAQFFTEEASDNAAATGYDADHGGMDEDDLLALMD